MTSQNTGNLELFETEFLMEFPNITVTAIVDYIIGKNKSLIITGDKGGVIRLYEREGSKLVQKLEKQIGKSKIDKLISNAESKNLYILTNGNLFIYGLPDLKLKPNDDVNKELFKDIEKIVENDCPKNKNELMIIKKNKKIVFLEYNHEISKVYKKEYKDKGGNPLDITLKGIPDKIKWYGNYFSYILKDSVKIFYNTIKIIDPKKEMATLIEKQQDLPGEDVAFIQSYWLTNTGGFCLFTGTDGEAASKNMINLNQSDPFIELEIFNDLHIISLHEKSIGIYDFNDGQCVQELTTDTSDIPVEKFLSKGGKSIFLISINKKEGAKDGSSNLWELREFSFEKQIQLSLERGQTEKAFGILNNKLEYNMDKFIFLESFYCDCAWNSFKNRNKEGFEEAHKYFSLCNFNPFELIYHFIKILGLKPIHNGFEDVNNLPKEVNDSQIDGDVDKDENIKAAISMLVETLQLKKTYLLTSNKLIQTERGKNEDIAELSKNIDVSFQSSKNCSINLQNVEPKEIKLYDVLKIINEVLVKGMVLLKTKIATIEEIIENDQFNTEFSTEFLFNIKTFQSDMALAYIYKKSKKYFEVLDILDKYINDLSKAVESKESRNLLQKILIGFGKNIEYTEVFEKGLKILLTNHYNLAFEILLTNELISIDNFRESILPQFDLNNTTITKNELFLKLLCTDNKYSNYSNEKYQTAYMELLAENLFKECEKDSDIISKTEDVQKSVTNRYKDFKEYCSKFTKYRKDSLLLKINDSWMFDIEIYLLTELQRYNEAIQKLVELVKSNRKNFEDIREYCKNNYRNDNEIFQQYFKILRKNYDENNKNQMFKKEMLKILDLFVNGDLLDEEAKNNKNKLELLNLLNPKEILGLIPNDWKLNEPLDDNDKEKTLYNLLRFYLKEYAIINNNYKRLENLAKMDLIYKQMKLHELKDKHVLLDINTSCYLCNKKIQNNTVFLVYPNGHIYHSRCSPDLHIEIKTGRNFENFDY